ncbi:hypothetical protein Aduo_005388 [Ancylostoma duodenale]
MYTGAKELCELKVGSVKSDDNLADSIDNILPLEEDDDDKSLRAGYFRAKKELVTRTKSYTRTLVRSPLQSCVNEVLECDPFRILRNQITPERHVRIGTLS